METVTITMKNPPALYLEADIVSPDAFAGKTAAQIGELPVYEGNVASTLGKYFDVSGSAGATAADAAGGDAATADGAPLGSAIFDCADVSSLVK